VPLGIFGILLTGVASVALVQNVWRFVLSTPRGLAIGCDFGIFAGIAWFVSAIMFMKGRWWFAWISAAVGGIIYFVALKL